MSGSSLKPRVDSSLRNKIIRSYGTSPPKISLFDPALDNNLIAKAGILTEHVCV